MWYQISNVRYRISGRVIIWPDTGYFSNIRNNISILFKKKKKRKQGKNSDNNFFIPLRRFDYYFGKKCDWNKLSLQRFIQIICNISVINCGYYLCAIFSINYTVRQNLTFFSYGDHDPHFLIDSRLLNPNLSAKDAHHVRFWDKSNNMSVLVIFTIF